MPLSQQLTVPGSSKQIDMDTHSHGSVGYSGKKTDEGSEERYSLANDEAHCSCGQGAAAVRKGFARQSRSRFARGLNQGTHNHVAQCLKVFF